MSEREAGQLYPVAKAIIKPLFSFTWRFHVEGAENVPREGPAIICPNHTSVLDSFFVPSVLPRRITYVGKAEYMDSWKTKHLFPAMGMIPIDRGGGSASERALSAAQRVLERGELFGIYPEGTRSRDGRLYKGHTGPARLALRTGAPIIPVGIRGARDVMPPEARYPTPFRPVVIRFGAPIAMDRFEDRAGDRLVLRQIIDEVMFSIRDMSGQEYVNQYATKKAETMPAEVAQVGGQNLDVSDPAGPNGHGHGSGEPDEIAVDDPETGAGERPRSAAAALAGARRRSS
ncbi:1-acyl-sn-glycerol-3-phosphate acyltransferase [Iamia sp. SCSIO 61187]|uniref:lysophospholipid acyltransferase family protein n=1 Tax=Iamia sp. SCSIO 61187 TaxID=2722752 RepID=UPI001C62616A|nr:lysophospholipid acyltransferase family protein [Iamia sp. SCSIO 61187]QYG93419.1 1-acyl-sn-glycerol-3-phosphate acyltransferase [Iamia sp. SCSIO 61187]